MKQTCVVSVAFRTMYVNHSIRQEEFLSVSNVDRLIFRDRLPTKFGIVTDNIVETFQKSLYGFKPHAIQYAIEQGYKKIIWLDPSVLPTTSLDVLINSLDKHPMIVRIGDQNLKDLTNQKALDYFNTTKEKLEGVKSLGGTIYCFNFNNPKVLDVFNRWKRAEEDGIFGTQDDFMAGHWADESCMALSMYKEGMKQYWEEGFTYQNQKEL